MAYRERKKWYESPWVWVTSGCCLGCVVVPLVLVGVFGAGIFYLFKSTGVRDEAVERARTHPAVVEALGEPIEAGWMIQGSINIHHEGGDPNEPSGEADFSLPLSGPEGEGRLYVRARRFGGEWVYEELSLAVEGRGSPIDLLEEAAPGLLEAPEEL